ncbi:MAG: hypothetical protein EOP86_04355 [Verrucomicrobiaceae bacterium]|nr:MAG: hypothetical protein EOP86_04355 [Verrucomicrobiaceae bacterium]
MSPGGASTGGRDSAPPAPAASQAQMENLQKQALRRLFSALYWSGRRTPKNQPLKTRTLMTRKYGPLVFFALLGLILLPFAFPPMPPRVSFVMVHVLTLVMTGMSAATACGTLLFNDQESDILLHRPVPARFILLAKVRVLFGETARMAVALNIAGMAAIALTRGPGAWRYVPAHLFSVTLQALFCVSAVVLAFQLCAKLFGQARVKSLITASQVVAAVVLMAGGQLAPRLMHSVDLVHWSTSPWIIALPPAWFGGLDLLVTTLEPTPQALAGTALALGVTALTSWLAFSRLAGVYEETVVTLNEHTASPAASYNGKGRWAERLPRLPLLKQWLRDPLERTGFMLAMAQLGRARDVKLRVYPQIAQWVVYAIIFSFSTRRAESSDFSSAAVTGFLGIIPFMTVELMRYSEEYRGAELFRFAPLASAAPLFFGVRKAVLLLITLPVFLLCTVLMAVISQNPIGLAMLLPGMVLAYIMSAVPALTSPFLPFSETQVESKGVKMGCLMSSLGLAVSMGVSAVSWLAWTYGWFTVWLGCMLAAAVMAEFLFRRIIRSRGIVSDE